MKKILLVLFFVSPLLSLAKTCSISISATVAPASCAGNCDGDITMTVSGGTGPYTYSWYYGDVTKDLHGICPGTYCETIYDSVGCSLDTCFVITEPSPILPGVNVKHVSCAGGADGDIYFDVSGGQLPYKYLWVFSGDTTNEIDSLVAGAYCYQITDAKGCGINDCITLTEPQPYTITASITEPKCYGGNDGCLTLNVSGGTPSYTYLWNSGATTKNLCPVQSTFFSVHITDSLGCTADTSYNVDQPSLLDVDLTGYNTTCIGCNDGMITAIATGGISPYTYAWSPNISTSASANGLAAGTYSVCVTDMNACSSCDVVVIFNDPTFINNGINSSLLVYPNPAKDRLWVVSNELQDHEVIEITNVLGENIYRSQLITQNSKLITPIDVSSFPKGIYFIKMISDKGEIIDAKKIMIE